MIAIKIIRAEVASIKTLIECKVVERGFTEAKCFFLKFAIAMSKQKICKIEFSKSDIVEKKEFVVLSEATEAR